MTIECPNSPSTTKYFPLVLRLLCLRIFSKSKCSPWSIQGKVHLETVSARFNNMSSVEGRVYIYNLRWA